MTVIPATEAKRNFYQIIDDINPNSSPVMVTRSDGRNVVLIDEDDWNSIKETLYINSIPGLAESIIDASNAPDSEFLDESEVEW